MRRRILGESIAVPFVAFSLLGGAAVTAAGCGSASGPKVVFDALGGGDPRIQVYQGPSANDHDRTSNGYYHDGAKIPADCKAEGRSVASQVGEEKRQSDWWIRLDPATTAQTEWVTAVYVANPDDLLKALPMCAGFIGMSASASSSPSA